MAGAKTRRVHRANGAIVDFFVDFLLQQIYTSAEEIHATKVSNINGLYWQ